ncbi:MAG: hypothetical protein JO075_11265, partial [Acidimicrobiia bacterium]|nr:hypothetical protein [Acidimicrobiia bacterium]
MHRVGGRAHIEVRGIHGLEAHDLRSAVEAALLSHAGVTAVDTLAALGRVAVAFDDEATSIDDLVVVVEAVEDETGVAEERFPFARAELPGDVEQWHRDLVALGADVSALIFAGVGYAARLTRLPAEVAGVFLLVQNQPPVRRALASLIGTGPADVAFAVAGAGAQALANGPLGLVVDGVHRVSLAMESRARIDSWRLCEPDLVDRRPRPEVHDWPARPVPLPDGPIEHYQREALLASGAAFAASGLVTRNLRRAAAAAVVTTPKAAALGRD